jgi:NAD(P)H-nitrite reductase large subunit
VHRELFLVGGKPVGGALIGDISAAGTLHALISAGRQLTAADEALVRPKSGHIIRFSENRGPRQALILSSKR